MSDSVRVVQLVYNFHIEGGGGGLTRAAIDIGQHLDPERFDASLIALGDFGTPAEKKWIADLNQRGVRALAATQWDEHQPYQSFGRAYQALRRRFQQDLPDILHSHSEFSDIAAVLLKLEGKTRVAMRTTHYGHATEWRNSRLRRTLFTNFLYPLLFDLEIGVNPALQARLNQRRLAKWLNKKALFISEAVQLERFRRPATDVQAKRGALGIPPDALVVGCVARLAEQKGHTDLLQAAARVLAREPRAYFLIVGDGPLADELKQQAGRLGISERVQFTGSRTDVEELLACFDLFAMASLWEGMPISVLESMSAGTPVLTTRIPGSQDVICHGENGWLAPPADPGAFSQAILELLAAPQRRAALAKNALETVQEYSSAAISARYSKIYQDLKKVSK